MQMGWGVNFTRKKRYDGVGGGGSNFQEKKRYATLEWPILQAVMLNGISCCQHNSIILILFFVVMY